MSIETLAFTVRCWRDSQVGATRLQVARIDEGNDVELANGSFVVRVMIDRRGALTRCAIRHAASGREAYLQGGSELSAFVKQCLLEPEVADSDGTGG